MYYHASNVKGLKVLKPHVSMHGKSWVYFSDKKENVLIYLSNAVEKFIKDKYNRPLKEYKKWASYGFTKDGRVRIEEYYPNATELTFKGVEGYIYKVEELKDKQPLNGIKNVFVTKEETIVSDVEKIQDAYDAVLEAEKQGLIEIERYETLSQERLQKIRKMITSEFEETQNEDYKEFLLSNFVWLKEEKKQ